MPLRDEEVVRRITQLERRIEGLGSVEVFGATSITISGSLSVGGSGIIDGDLRIGGGLYVGDTGVDPDSDWIYADGGLYVNETVNTDQQVGITLNQGTDDNQILALKSEGDVAHGITDYAETDTYAYVKKYAGDDGGVAVGGLTEATVAAEIVGYGTTANTSKDTSARGFVQIAGYQKSGTGVGASDANANILTILTRRGVGVEAVIIFDEDGDIYFDGSTSPFDAEDDMALIREITELSSMGDEDRRERTKSGERKRVEELGIMKMDDRRVFLSSKQHGSLVRGALTQLDKIIHRQNRYIERLEARIEALENA